MKEEKVCIIGFGRSGEAVARLLKRVGAKVCVTEKKPKESFPSFIFDEFSDVEFEFGTHTFSFLDGCTLLVPSPGVEPTHPLLQEAERRGIPIMSEIEIGYSFLKECRIIAITGTNGKTTTASLLHHILNEGGKKSLLCGNIGLPLCSVIEEAKKVKRIVLEVSSFQLQFIKEFRPHIAILLNIAEDHLDWHKNIEEYARAKMRIFENQTKDDFSILNKRDLIIKEILPNLKTHVFYVKEEEEQSCFIKDAKIWIKKGKDIKNAKIENISAYLLQNLENLLSAVLAAYIEGMELEEIIDAVKTFKGLEHRMELVEIIDGVPFINDSKATNPHATLSALSSIDSPIVLICGGRPKKEASLKELQEAIKKKVKTLIVMGEAREVFKKAFGDLLPMYLVNDMEEAVSLAYNLALPNDFVLFSPACSSHDMFRDFEERGNVFKEEVRKLVRNAKRN